MMRTLGFSGALSVLALAAPFGCGEPFSSTSGGTGGATTTTTTTTSEGGQGGVGGVGGDATTSSTGGMGGEGGAPGCTPEGCGPGEYCAASGECTSCTEVGDEGFLFDTPVMIPLGNQSVKLFPRVRNEPGGGHRMVYSSRVSGDNYDIATSVDDSEGVWGNGVIATGTGINTVNPELGPMLMPSNKVVPATPAVVAGALVFDSLESANVRKAFAANNFGAISRSQVNLDDEGDTFSVAIAHALSAPYRYWFMSRRSISGVNVNRMYTRRLPDPSTTVSIVLYPGCTVPTTTTTDLAPWVTPDGKYLFFNTIYDPNESCNQGTVIRSFYARLNTSTGQLAEPPVWLNVMGVGINVKTPSLSPDMCTLYFAADAVGHLEIYSARRRSPPPPSGAR